MRPLHELALAGSCLVLAIGIFQCSPVLPSDRPLGRGPLAFNQEPAEQKRAAPEAVSTNAEDPASSTPEAGAPSSSAPSGLGTLGSDAGASTTAAKPVVMGDAGPGKSDFSGEYLGRDRETLRIEGGPEMTTGEDPNAKTRVRARADGNLEIVFVASNVDSELCKVEAKPSGNAASIRAGQLCKEWKEELGPLRNGHASFNGKQLTVDLEFDFEASGDESDERIQGIWIYHFEGTKR